jgi:hypothetical protein
VTSGAEGWAAANGAFLDTVVERAGRLAERHLAWLQEEGERDLAAVGALDDIVATLDERLERKRKELIDLGRPDGLTALSGAAGLNEVEAEAVATALAADLDPAVGSLYADLHQDPARRHATAGLVAALHRLDATATWQLIDPRRPLLRFALVERVGTPGETLRVDRRVIRFILGDGHLDERLTGLVSIPGPIPLPRRLADEADRLAAWLIDPTSSGPTAINLVGPSAETRAAFATRLLRSVGMVPLRLDLERLAARADRGELVRLIERECVLLPAGVDVELEAGPDEGPSSTAASDEVLDELGGLTVIGGPTRREGRRPTLVVEVGPLTAPDRAELWETVLGTSVDELEGLDGVIEQFALGPESIVRAAAEARSTRAARDGVAVDGRGDAGRPGADDLWDACRLHVGRDLQRLAHRVQPLATWDDLILPPDQIAVLRELTAQLDHRATVYEEWGFGNRLSRGRGVSALFTGPPGTGKTMAAEIMAGELRLDLYRIDLASVVSKYIGETEKNLKRVFDAAERGGAILFFDEADALFGKRTEVTNSHDRHANIEINYLLQRMEEYAGLAILATNRKADLDPAFLRRVRFIVGFPFPSEADRRRIWEVVLPPEVPRRGLDNGLLAKLELAGGNIRNAALNGAFRAAADGEPLAMDHLMAAARHEYRKLDKLPTRAEFGDHYEAVTA